MSASVQKEGTGNTSPALKPETSQRKELLEWTEVELYLPNSMDRPGHTERVRN